MSTATAINPFKVKASTGGGDYDLCAAGNHPGVLIGLVDLGTHTDEYKGKSYDARNIALVFELTAEHRPNGEPFVLAKQFNLFFSEKAGLRKLVEGWRGKKFEPDEEFDLSVLVDRPCLVNVSHKKSGDKTYHEIAGISAVPKGMNVPARSHDPFVYVCDPAEAPPNHDWMPFIFGEPMADIIERSHEFKAGGQATTTTAAANGTGGNIEDGDGIPF